MTASLRRQPAIDASIAAQMGPWNREAEDAAVKAWRALDSFTALSAADLRQERRALLEMQDMLARAIDASGVDRTLIAMKEESHG